MPSTYLSLHVHLIFATYDRKPMIAVELRPDLHAYIGGIIRKLGAEPLMVGGVADHVHILVMFKSTQCIADIVRETKKAATAWMSEPHRRPDFAWQEGYGAFTLSQPETTGSSPTSPTKRSIIGRSHPATSWRSFSKNSAWNMTGGFSSDSGTPSGC